MTNERARARALCMNEYDRNIVSLLSKLFRGGGEEGRAGGKAISPLTTPVPMSVPIKREGGREEVGGTAL